MHALTRITPPLAHSIRLHAPSLRFSLLWSRLYVTKRKYFSAWAVENFLRAGRAGGMPRDPASGAWTFLSPLRGLFVSAVLPAACAAGCILSPLRGFVVAICDAKSPPSTRKHREFRMGHVALGADRVISSAGNTGARGSKSPPSRTNREKGRAPSGVDVSERTGQPPLSFLFAPRIPTLNSQRTRV